MAVIAQRPSELVRDAFRAWHAERESLDAELSESLSALSAYQSHLDNCQEQLARERAELTALRGQIERDRAALEQNQGQVSAQVTAELQAARDKIGALTASLLNRTEELRTLDGRRSELVTELELSRVREKELRAAFDDQKRTLEQQRRHGAEEIQRLRELLERQSKASNADAHDPAPAASQHSVANQAPTRPAASSAAPKGESAVLGSIVEQFGKLRQQRAVDRQSLKRPR